MKYRLSEKEESYWSNVLISIAQVLFGIAAVTFFTGELDISKVRVIVFNLALSAVFWMSGWKLSR